MVQFMLVPESPPSSSRKSCSAEWSAMERARDDNNNLGVSVKKSNEAISVSVFQSVDGKTRNVERLRVENFRHRQLFLARVVLLSQSSPSSFLSPD